MRGSLELLRKCWFLGGPTACGKTATSLRLAEKIDAEIISVDSMALYRGMDIGTAKPNRDEQQQCPHHLIDVIDPHEEYSVTQYVDAATIVCEEILSRGRTPLFVGGTGFYLQSFLRGVFEGPSADWEIRQQLDEELAEQGADALHAQLAKHDPVTAARVHPNDSRRVIRALEVFRITGEPLSAHQQQPALPPEDRPPHIFWIDPPREWLRNRVDLRVTQMIDAGLIDEVQQLRSAEKPLSRTARQAIGYKELIEAFDEKISFDRAIELIQIRSRQYAKRQCTWFRNMEECVAIPIVETMSADEIVDKLLQMG